MKQKIADVVVVACALFPFASQFFPSTLSRSFIICASLADTCIHGGNNDENDSDDDNGDGRIDGNTVPFEKRLNLVPKEERCTKKAIGL